MPTNEPDAEGIRPIPVISIAYEAAEVIAPFFIEVKRRRFNLVLVERRHKTPAASGKRRNRLKMLES
ncbi:hypothetical protein [Stutzerimonas nosocomialis]|uniref:hypothetical protein n=1 Tax=Stutzerimonas nosocomialis TaxID=1056496 RepID=UPI00110855E2|nr:hypothetical protein [Stutzerimonas nosocomialis]